jgi:polar amino acid transport system substrate-binding protein
MKFAYLIEPPFNYVDSIGRVTGCDVELARHIFKQLGVTDFKLVETEFAELLPGLGKGRWRMTTGLFATEERRQIACFSRPIWALADGLLVAKGNPLELSGYKSVADNPRARLAVIRDQVQHRRAVELGVSLNRISIFETYTGAARAVSAGQADAYASVGRAHNAFIQQNPDWGLDAVLVPNSEKPPAFGSFAFALGETNLLQEVDQVLSEFLGTDAHRKMVSSFGFSSIEVDLVTA